MVYQVVNDTWFDSEKLFIVKGEEKKQKYLDNYDAYPDVKEAKKPEDRYPVLTFLSSVLCNLKCVYCYADHGNYNHICEQNTFTFENYLKAYETVMAEYGGIRNICFFGGEPLLDFKEIKKFVVYLNEHVDKDKLPTFSIGSNGTILDDEILDFMEEYHILFGTSLDGSKQFNDKSRIGDGIDSVYDKVMETLQRLDERNITCVIQFTFTQVHLDHYKPGDAKIWMQEFEKLPIKYYELIAATTQGNLCEIDLRDKQNVEKLEKMSSEIAQYSLEALVDGRTTIMSSIFANLIWHLSKKQKTKHCDAGLNITIAPDMRIYPCHTIANDRANSIACEPGFLKEMAQSAVFEKMRTMSRNDYDKCSECIAKNVCNVFCKGMCETCKEPPEERCIMMRVFLKETIKFLMDEYPNHKKEISESVKKIMVEHTVI